jgi:hypothetical protein
MTSENESTMKPIPSSHCGRFQPVANRREFLARAGAGLGTLALAGLLEHEKLLAAEASPNQNPIPSQNPLAPRPSHFAPKAKAVIWLFMEGGPSGFDLFDPKPELQKNDGKRIAVQTFFGDPGPLMKSPFTFKQFGESGTWVCDRLPYLAEHVDKLALIKSCVTESNNHAPGMFQMNTGMARTGFPAAGAWINYGLGSENQNLPGFVVLGNNHGSKGGPLNWSAGFLPSAYQGTLFRSQGSPILNLKRPAEVSAADQRAQLDLLAQLNAEHQSQHPGEADLLARIQSFELAYRMQTEADEAVNLAEESAETKRLYGCDDNRARPFGEKCLLARRLVERGVRFVQAYCNDEWDAHGNLRDNHRDRCAEIDQPVAGLLADLQRRGLLDSTLVVWGGEFGRMPVSEKGQGRDHNPHGFLVWMAGAGIKGGTSYGETDEFGLRASVNPVSVNDLHATILNQLGLDHTRLTYLHNGRRFRLTDVAGKVLNSILN